MLQSNEKLNDMVCGEFYPYSKDIMVYTTSMRVYLSFGGELRFYTPRDDRFPSLPRIPLRKMLREYIPADWVKYLELAAYVLTKTPEEWRKCSAAIAFSFGSDPGEYRWGVGVYPKDIKKQQHPEDIIRDPSVQLRYIAAILFGSADDPTKPTTHDYKEDAGKPDFTLLHQDMAPVVADIVGLLHWGHYTKGYPREGYKTLESGDSRLLAACYRHLAAAGKNLTEVDTESGKLHLTHATINLMMLLARKLG